MDDTASLLERVLQHDQDALAEVYDRYYDQIYRYINFRLRDPEVSADLAAEVFFALVSSLKKGKPPRTSLTGWLYTVARNLIVDYVKKQSRQVPLFDDMVSDDSSLLEQAHLAHLTPILETALDQLTEEQQHVIALRFGRELSLAETATLLKKSVGAVKALQHRAIASLARLMPNQEGSQ